MNITIKDVHLLDRSISPQILACVGNLLRGDIQVDGEKNLGVMKLGIVVANIKITQIDDGYTISYSKVS